jgi:hypothetical protein
MQLIAVTTCTDRKKFPVPADLDASRVPTGSQSAVASAWRKRIKSAPAVALATDVYSGRSFQEAVAAAREGRADFRIISGGLGLVRGDEKIPSYSLSLVRKSDEFVGARVINEPFNVARWWGEIQRAHESTPLAKLLRANADAIIVIGISSSYLPLVSKDLTSLKENGLDRIRLIGMGIEDACPPELRDCVLPYDDRLDGPDSPRRRRGTRGDFSSRAMRHFIEEILPEHRSGSLATHKAAVKRFFARWRHPKVVSRQSMTDDEIIKLIKKNWKVTEGKSSRSLRYLRDIEKIACEQGRFATLFHRAAKLVTP